MLGLVGQLAPERLAIDAALVQQQLLGRLAERTAIVRSAVRQQRADRPVGAGGYFGHAHCRTRRTIHELRAISLQHEARRASDQLLVVVGDAVVAAALVVGAGVVVTDGDACAWAGTITDLTIGLTHRSGRTRPPSALPPNAIPRMRRRSTLTPTPLSPRTLHGRTVSA